MPLVTVSDDASHQFPGIWQESDAVFPYSFPPILATTLRRCPPAERDTEVEATQDTELETRPESNQGQRCPFTDAPPPKACLQGGPGPRRAIRLSPLPASLSIYAMVNSVFISASSMHEAFRRTSQGRWGRWRGREKWGLSQVKLTALRRAGWCH